MAERGKLHSESGVNWKRGRVGIVEQEVKAARLVLVKLVEVITARWGRGLS